MEKSQKAYEEFRDEIRFELFRKMEAGELSKEEIEQLKKEELEEEENIGSMQKRKI